MRSVVFHASPQLNGVNPGFPQNRSRIFNSHKIEQQICREIAASTDHCMRKSGYLCSPSNGRIELWRRVTVLGDAKKRSICRAEETVSHVQGIVEGKSAFVCGSKHRQQHRHFDRARSMKPTVAA